MSSVQYTTVVPMKYEPVMKERGKMKICVISTASLLTPPTAYAGIERVAWDTVRGLSGLGHTVHLIAKTGSAIPPNGKLFEIEEDRQALPLADALIKHFGVEVFLDESHDKLLSTHRPAYKQLTRYQVMSKMGDPRCPMLISEGQRHEKFNDAPWPIIPQSIDLDTLPLYMGVRDNYLAYLGQKITEKRIEWACDVAVKSQTPLWIHGPGWGQADCHERINRYATDYPSLIHNSGEVGGIEKLQKLQSAKALIHLPGALNWSEAGGIVVLEAMAVGTPCIVSRNGALPGYIVDGVNGFVVDSVEEAVNALGKIDSIRPEDCRASVEKYDYRRLAPQYEALLQRVLNGEQWN